jgi:hypothetical protein
MQPSPDTIATALRVLTAITGNRSPEQSDIDALCAFAGPCPVDVELDVFLCDVVQKALKQHPSARGQTA